MPQATQLSYLGVGKDTFKTTMTAASIATATTLNVVSTAGWGSSGNITVYSAQDGSLTETKAYSAVTSTTITCTAMTNAHSAGDLVVVTAAANAPTAYIPVTTLDPFDNYTMLDDKGYRGAFVDVYNLVQGVEHSEFGVNGDVFPDTFPWYIGAIFGDESLTGAGAPYTHTFSQNNSATAPSGAGQPTSLTLTDFDSLTASGQARAYPASVCSDLTITWNSEALLTYTSKWTGFPSGIVAKPTQSFTTITPSPGWAATTTIGGTFNPRLTEATVDVKRAVSIINTLDGNQKPYSIWLGPSVVTGKLTFIADDEVELLRYLNATRPSLSLDFTQGVGAALVELKYFCTTAAYRSAKVMRSKDYVEIDVEYDGLANTTDAGSTGGYSPGRFTCQNAVSTKYQ